MNSPQVVDPRNEWQRSRMFLSTWERPIGSPREKIEHAHDTTDLTPRDLFAAANLASLYLARSGRLEEAQELLEVQITAAVTAPEVLIWTLDARVNIARLDVIRRDHASAMVRYRQLRDLVAWEHDDMGLGFGRAELHASAPDQIELVQALRALRNGLAGDLCRLHWRTGQLWALRDLAEDFRRRWPTASGAGRTFPLEARLLLDPVNSQESLPDNEPDDLIVRVLHHASYDVTHARESAEAVLVWAEESVDAHLGSCAGCSSCVDWLIDLASSEARAGREARRWWDQAVDVATTLSDHAGLMRLASLVDTSSRAGIDGTLSLISPGQELLREASTGLSRRIKEVAA